MGPGEDCCLRCDIRFKCDIEIDRRGIVFIGDVSYKVRESLRHTCPVIMGANKKRYVSMGCMCQEGKDGNITSSRV